MNSSNGFGLALLVARTMRSYVFSLHVLFAISVVLLPWVVVWLVSFGDMPDEWNAELIQQSLQNGTFWLLPGHVIFQDSTEIGGNDIPLSVLTAVLLVSFVVWGYVALQFRVFAFFAKLVVFKTRSLAKMTGNIAATPQPLRQLFPLASNKKTWVIEAYGQEFTVAEQGRSLILTNKLPARVPSLFFDSVKNDIARREGRRLQFARQTMLVLDGVMYEHFKVYAPPAIHVQLAHGLKSDFLALVTKQLDDIEISTENDTLAAVIDVRKLRNEKDMDRIVNGLVKLGGMLVEVAKKVPNEDKLQVKSIESVTMFLGIWPLSNMLVAIMSLSFAGMFVVMAEALGSRALTGDMILPLVIIGLFLLARVYRRLKHRAGVRLFEEVA